MEIKYQDKIVAFIDVLGFSEIVYSNTTESITKYFEIISSDFHEVVIKNHFKLILISDSIVISAKHDNSNFKLMIKILWKLQGKLLSEGILLRGAVSFGDLYLNKSKNIIVGPGLINAYKLESQAIYPRIILDRRFINQYYDGTQSSLIDTRYGMNDLLRFKPPIPYLADFVYLDYTKSVGYSNANREYNQIMMFLKNNYYLNAHIQKYEWLRRHLICTTQILIKQLIAQPTITKRARKRIREAEDFLEKLDHL